MIIMVCMICVYGVAWCAHWRGQSALCFPLRTLFSPHTFMWVLGIELQLPGEGLHVPSLLAAPGSEQQEYNENDGELWVLVVKRENECIRDAQGRLCFYFIIFFIFGLQTSYAFLNGNKYFILS